MRIFYLAVGTALTVLMLIELLKGRKYAKLTENLDPGEFPLRSIYTVGIALSFTKPLALKGKAREKLVGQAKLLYEPKYAEYYATMRWSQVISFVLLSLTAGFLAAGLMDSGLMLFIGVVVGAVFGWYFMNRMNDLLSTRQDDCTQELPEIVTTMALLINAGMLLRTAWRTIAESKKGTVYELMRESCSDMDNGMSEVDAIHKFGRSSNSQEVRKFTSAMAQSIERGGGGELSDFLSRQSMEMMVLKKQLMLQKGEAAASKLLMPTALLFVGIIIAVISGALGMLI